MNLKKYHSCGILYFIVAILALSTPAHSVAGDLEPSAVVTLLKKARYSPSGKVVESPAQGYYRVVFSGDIDVLASKDGRVAAIGGALINLHTHNILSKSEAAKERTLLLSALEESGYLAKIVLGKGEKKVFAISALDCPACRKDHNYITSNANRLNATVFYIPNILSKKMADDWLSGLACGKNKEKIWNDGFGKNRLAPSPVSDCRFNKRDSLSIFAFLTSENGKTNLYTPQYFASDGYVINANRSNSERYFGVIFN